MGCKINWPIKRIREDRGATLNSRNSLRYAILGTGALGGLYGGLLAHCGVETHFLVRSDFEHVRHFGLKIESPWGSFDLPQVSCFDSAESLPPVDVAIVAWKTTANAALKETLQHVCGPHTLVLVLQNGWDIEREAAECVGSKRVLGGCCFLCCNKVGPGHIQHLDYGRIVFGEYDRSLSGNITERMRAIASDFQLAGIEIQPAVDLRSVRWRKLMWNIPYNGLSVVLNADTSQIMSAPASASLAEALMHEVREAAACCGCVIEESFVDKLLEDTRKMVPYDSSMRLDFRAARPIEVEAIFGSPLRAALSAGFKAPRIEMLYHQLVFLDRHNRKASAVAHPKPIAQDPNQSEYGQ